MSAPPPAPAPRPALPTADTFASDPRVSYDKQLQKWTFEDPDTGNEFEWDPVKSTWIAVADDDMVRKQQAAYSVAGVDESTPAAPIAAREARKRKDYTSNTAPPPKKSRSDKPPPPATAVFVSRLPPDATVDEIASAFSKCGIIHQDDEGRPKIKLYTDEQGNFKGEALVVFFRPGSVELAVRLMDDAEFRLGNGDSGRIRVEVAEFKKKERGEGGQGGEAVGGGGGGGGGGEQEKKKVQKKLRKMENKLTDWSSEDESGLADRDLPSSSSATSAPASAKYSRVVVLRHMFTLDELARDPTLLLDLKDDVREEAETIGRVTNVVLYDAEPDGVMTIKFADPIAAQACIIKMNNRYFAGRRIVAAQYDGRETFRTTKSSDVFDADADEKERLEDFGKWLMEGGEGNS